VVRLEAALGELERAALAVQQLAASLEQNPSAILYGRPVPEETR
jgi:hypothetical protein